MVKIEDSKKGKGSFPKIVLIGFVFLIFGSVLSWGIDSGELDELCDVDGSILYKNATLNGNWSCASVPIGITESFGEAWYHNHTATPLSFDVDGLFYNLTFKESTTKGFVFSDAEDSLTASVSGWYKVCYMASGDGQNNHMYFTTVVLNGATQDKCGSHKKMAAGGDIVTMVGCCVIELNADDELKLATADIGGTGAGNYYSSNLNLVRIGDS